MSGKKKGPAATAGTSEKMLDPNSSAFFEELMNDPHKRALVLELLEQQKSNIASFKKKEAKKLQVTNSPLKKVKSRMACESPTALMRRRGLEKQQKENNDVVSERSSSRQSESSYRTASSPSSISPQPLPYDCLLTGVVAYVEIKSKDADRSAGAKALMRSMGAVVVDRFSSNVTHVVFKDGSFNTYQKAKLLKVPMVSILWLEAIRRNQVRVPEKNYPALGTEAYQNNISTICSQMQKEYEDVVKEDMRRSLSVGFNLDMSKKSIINNRRKTMLPFRLDRSSSRSSNDSVVKDSQNLEDQEICNITKSMYQNPSGSSVLANPTPEISSDDSDCGIVDGDLDSSKFRSRRVLQETPNELELGKVIVVCETPDINNEVADRNKNGHSSDILTPNSQCNKVASKNKNAHSSDITPKSQDVVFDDSASLLTRTQPRKSTIFESNMELTRIGDVISKSTNTSKVADVSSEDFKLNPKKSTIFESNMELTRVDNISRKSTNISSDGAPGKRISDCSTNISYESVLKKLCKHRSNSLGTSTMSSLQVSDQHKSNESVKNNSKQSDNSAMSSLRVSSENKNNSKDNKLTSEISHQHKTNESIKNNSKQSDNSVMSSLRVSSESKNNSKDNKLTSEILHQHKTNENIKNNSKQSDNSTMSSLRVSSEGKNNSKDNKLTSDMSSLRISKNSDDIHIVSNVIVNIEQLELTELDSHISNDTSDIQKDKTDDNLSFTPLKTDVVNNVLQILNEDVDKNVTRRNRRKTNAFEINKLKDNSDETKNNPKNVSDISSSPLKTGVVSNIDKNVKRQSRRKTNAFKKGKSKENSYETKNNTKNDKLTNVTDTSSSPGSFKSCQDKSGNSSNESSNNCNNENSTKKRRKLYNPNESIALEMPCDEEERKRKRLIKENNCVKENAIVPSILLPVVLVNNKDVENYNSSITESDDEHIVPTKTTKKQNKKVSKKSIKKRCSSEDEQKQLTEDIMNMKITTKTTPFLNKKTSPKMNTTKKVTVKLNTPNKKIIKSPIFKTPSKNKTQTKKRLNVSIRNKTEDKALSSTRKSLRLSQCPRKLYNKSSNSNSSDSDNILSQVTPKYRRSTLDFQSSALLSSSKKKKIEKKKIPTIVCTKLHKDECQVFKQIVRKLGGFRVEDEVSSETTHLVAGESKRTINILRAVARGCWIVRHEWLLKSLENGKWLQEEDYEATDFSPAVQQCRLQRQAFGNSYSMDIFENCGQIYIARSTIPRRSDLQELVELCKGKITTILRNAAISVGEYINCEEITSVSEAWILDSITFNKRKSTKKYLLKPKG